MSIQHREPEEQNDHFEASWRELKIRDRISQLVFWAGLFSMPSMEHRAHWSLVLISWLSWAAAVRLSKRFVKAFRCPGCGHEFFNAKSKIGNSSVLIAAKSCAHCGLLFGLGRKS